MISESTMPEAAIPAVKGVLSAAEISATVDTIAAAQLPDGNIPWFKGHHSDPWNLVEAAMALDVGGRHTEAERAYGWLASMQRPDGAWHAYYRGREIVDPTLDTNVSSYIAHGTWHHYLATGDAGFVAEHWPTVERAIDFALDHQLDSGAIAWHGNPTPDNQRGGNRDALLTGSSSIHASLRCALGLAQLQGHERPDWELSLAALAIAIAHRRSVFLDKARWAMDWYYPILAGVLRGEAAQLRLAAHWDTFVAEGRGVRCVSDHPWVTVAETCEFVMALDAVGLTERAHELFAWVQFLRTDNGAYWTGANFDGDRFDREGALFPVEQPTWNAAAVVLAANALGGTGRAAGLFRGEHLPIGLTTDDLLEAGQVIEAELAAPRDGACSSSGAIGSPRGARRTTPPATRSST